MKSGRFIDGIKVKARRTELGMSQRDIAKIIDSPDAYISRLENASGGTDCGVDYALRLAEALKTTVEEITSEFSN
jgi:transcriptional regulator with XRE-family HTH domain